MPSFDVVSEVNSHELANAVDQTNREVSNRFDFKGTDSRVELAENVITMIAPAEFQIKQINDILRARIAKRGIDVLCLDAGKITEAANEARQIITVKQGINQELAKKITRIIKDSGLKIQSAIQGEQVRVSGKKRDDLQAVISLLRNSKFELPLQYVNFRD